MGDARPWLNHRRAGRAIVLAVLLIISIASDARASRSYIDSLPRCEATAGEVPLRPANCQASISFLQGVTRTWPVPDDYNWGTLACPKNYPYIEARKDRPQDGARRLDINAEVHHYYIEEQYNEAPLERSNRYTVHADGEGSLRVGVSGPWWWEYRGIYPFGSNEPVRSKNPWHLVAVCHSDGQYGVPIGSKLAEPANPPSTAG